MVPSFSMSGLNILKRTKQVNVQPGTVNKVFRFQLQNILLLLGQATSGYIVSKSLRWVQGLGLGVMV